MAMSFPFLMAINSAFLLRTKHMPKKNCLIVHAAGRQLDLLRGEASRIARANGSIVPTSAHFFALKTQMLQMPSLAPATTSESDAKTASSKTPPTL